jgi:hypothetical protein
MLEFWIIVTLSILVVILATGLWITVGGYLSHEDEIGHIHDHLKVHSERLHEIGHRLEQITGRLNELNTRSDQQANYDQIFLGIRPEPEPDTQPMNTNRRRRRRKGRA